MCFFQDVGLLTIIFGMSLVTDAVTIIDFIVTTLSALLKCVNLAALISIRHIWTVYIAIVRFSLYVDPGSSQCLLIRLQLLISIRIFACMVKICVFPKGFALRFGGWFWLYTCCLFHRTLILGDFFLYNTRVCSLVHNTVIASFNTLHSLNVCVTFIGGCTASVHIGHCHVFTLIGLIDSWTRLALATFLLNDILLYTLLVFKCLWHASYRLHGWRVSIGCYHFLNGWVPKGIWVWF